MTKSFREALIFALDATGRSLRSVALGADVSYDQLKNVTQGRAKTTNVDDAAKVSRQFGVTLDNFLSSNLTTKQTVSISGKVGAGASIPLLDAYEKGDGPQVVCPPGLQPTGIVAVEVVGESMEPVYSPGDLLFYTRHTAEGVPEEAIGRRCICEDVDGMGWVKLVKRGTEPGRFHLVALNPDAANQHDVALKWAAPVRLHWPAELADRTE